MKQHGLRNFLALPYEDLEKLNLEAKRKATDPAYTQDRLRDEYMDYLSGEDRIKALTVCFSDLEGRFHMLDYDKKFLLRSHENLTFDGSSVQGFSQVNQSDLKLEIDWASIRWLPNDVFGPGKVIMFGLIKDRDGSYYESDMRSQLKNYCEKLYNDQKITTNVAVECEGFLFNGLGAEQSFNMNDGFEMVSRGGYFNSLPGDPLRQFIDAFADAQRAMGFENEKDHPEVAPSQFELNYNFTNALIAADQLQLYKLIARQIAANQGYTASFLPKPVAGINGNGMHCNISLSKEGKNLFFGGQDQLSGLATNFVDNLLLHANDFCLVMNSSVNSYRRLDPQYEAPNQIKSSTIDRTSMVRIPMANENSSRIEVRTVAPDANPYMSFLTMLRIGLEGKASEETGEQNSKRTRTRFLPDNIYDAMRHFKNSELMTEILGQETKDKYLNCKKVSAHRCPRELGDKVKNGEVLYHHEVTNQFIWSDF